MDETDRTEAASGWMLGETQCVAGRCMHPPLVGWTSAFSVTAQWYTALHASITHEAGTTEWCGGDTVDIAYESTLVDSTKRA